MKTDTQKCLQALETAGSGEWWIPLKDYENLYKISNLGRISSITHSVLRKNGRPHMVVEKILNPTNSQKGYLKVGLYKNKKQIKKFVHVLVALSFIPNPFNKTQINHKDGNKKNNCLDNLEWCTNIENVKHAQLHNLIPKGINHYTYKRLHKNFL